MKKKKVLIVDSDGRLETANSRADGLREEGFDVNVCVYGEAVDATRRQKPDAVFYVAFSGDVFGYLSGISGLQHRPTAVVYAGAVPLEAIKAAKKLQMSCE